MGIASGASSFSVTVLKMESLARILRGGNVGDGGLNILFRRHDVGCWSGVK